MQSRYALAHTHRSSCSAGRFSSRPLPPECQARCLEDPRARASRRRGRARLGTPRATATPASRSARLTNRQHDPRRPQGSNPLRYSFSLCLCGRRLESKFLKHCLAAVTVVLRENEEPACRPAGPTPAPRRPAPPPSLCAGQSEPSRDPARPARLPHPPIHPKNPLPPLTTPPRGPSYDTFNQPDPSKPGAGRFLSPPPPPPPLAPFSPQDGKGRGGVPYPGGG